MGKDTKGLIISILAIIFIISVGVTLAITTSTENNAKDKACDNLDMERQGNFCYKDNQAYEVLFVCDGVIKISNCDAVIVD